MLGEPDREVGAVVDDPFRYGRYARQADEQELVGKVSPLALGQELGVEFMVKLPHPPERGSPSTGRLVGHHRASHHCERSGLSLGGEDELFHRPRFGTSVRVEEDESIAGGAVEDLPQGSGLAASLFLDNHANSGVLRREVLGDLDGTVGTSASDDPDIPPFHPRRELLFDERDHRGTKMRLLVVSHDTRGESPRNGTRSVSAPIPCTLHL
jgi:hypothetical protein